MRRLLPLLIVAVGMLVPAAPAAACSKDDTTYLDAFVDSACLELPLTNTTLDAFGGLRLTTTGQPTTQTIWDTDTHFNTGVTFASTPFAPVGVRTLATEANKLVLPNAGIGLTLNPANPVLAPAGPNAAPTDNDDVADPSVVRAGDKLVMFYAGTDEDGRGPAIFRAESPATGAGSGVTWTKYTAGVSNGPAVPVLEPTEGAFDEMGVSSPDVVFDGTKFHMWYSGEGPVFGGVGYATSSDGITWEKHSDEADRPVAVLDHGLGGSGDSFAAADPSVLKDGSTWKMWYTGDDSNLKRIMYATSPDGIVWSKGGMVVDPVTGSANYKQGVFEPSVWKTATGYRMVVTGRSCASDCAGTPVYRNKLQETTSLDGITWSAPDQALNGNHGFDEDELSSADVFETPGAGNSTYRLYYSGTVVDTSGRSHTRIGLTQTSTGSGWQGGFVAGSGGLNSVLGIGTYGQSFDGRSASGLSVVAPPLATPKYYGVYHGFRNADSIPRLGHARSPDGSVWTKVPGTRTAGSILDLGNNAQFDNKGQRDPALVYDSGAYHLFFTGLASDGVTTAIGYATSTDNGINWTKTTTAKLTAASHPTVVNDGGTWVMYYNRADGQIGRATASAAAGPWTAGGAVSGLGTGARDPIAYKDGATWHLLYSRTETLEGKSLERVYHATSAAADGVGFLNAAPLIEPSRVGYAFDEVGVRADGALLDGAGLQVFFSGVDRTGRLRGGQASSADRAAGKAPRGSATYQLGNAATSSPIRDFRRIVRTSTETGTGDPAVQLWLSFLQPYSTDATETKSFWSAYFPVTVADDEELLNLLLTVKGVRWQARLTDPSRDPQLDSVQIDHADVTFSPSGSATTTPITPPAGRAVEKWTTLTAESSVFSPATAGAVSGTVKVLNADATKEVASTPLVTGGKTTLDLSALSVAEYPTLKVRFDLQSADGRSTPLVRSLNVGYAPRPGDKQQQPPPPPPPPAPALTLAAAPTVVVFGQPVTLSGTLARPTGPLGGAAVKLFANNAPLPDAVTSPTGAFSAAHTPQANTTYRASFPGAVADATAAVQVKHLVKLRVVRRGSRGTFSGSVAPAHPGVPVVVQRRSGTSWVTFATFKTGATSTFTGTKRLRPRTKYRFRAVTAADADHLGGESAVVLVERQRLSLKITLSGRKATFSGTVRPLQKSGAVVIQVQKGTRWVTLAKTTLSRRSTFRVSKRLSKGAYKIRARRATNRYYFSGLSAVKSLRVR